MTALISYSLRNLRARKVTNLLTAAGMGLVVFVFTCVLMLDAGLHASLVTTGRSDNAVVTRRSAGSEVQSQVDRSQVRVIEMQPEIAIGASGMPMISKETVVLIALTKRGSSAPTNVTVRGMSEAGIALRPQAAIVQGRVFTLGTSEIVVGRSIAERFGGTTPGSTLRFGLRDWTVVGVFDSGGSGFDSEIWGDAEQVMQSFRREAFSSVIMRLNDTGTFETLKERLQGDPKLTVDVKRERRFYEEQSELLSNFIRILGVTLSIVFSFGATIGAMITMYSAVANRVAEIGSLRALGFRRSSVLCAFLVEGVGLSLIGWMAGLAMAALMQMAQISTLNWQTLTELAFRFTLTPPIIAMSLVFALAMGVIGAFLPALKASRLQIVEALRRT
jgi:ABC-type lipoprotein release transport system permease subunit